MSEFNYRKNGLSVNQYGADHVSARLNTLHGRDERTVVIVSHFPQAAEGAENQSDEFYSVDIEVLSDKPPYNHTAISAHLTREDIERLHFVTGRLLAQSAGMGRGAAHSRVVGDPQDEEKTCQDCSVIDPEPVGDAEEQYSESEKY
ncbi:hypothetical protein LCGC14_1435310 [marine sediment metagenome]|uniref:Uncharacterized protein n=1 Tax=marine sediment metagenome TaxID=412755 RepID=A0A0F9M2V2_9ZZZZ